MSYNIYLIVFLIPENFSYIHPQGHYPYLVIRGDCRVKGGLTTTSVIPSPIGAVPGYQKDAGQVR